MKDRSTPGKSVALRARANAKTKAQRDAEARSILDHPAYAPVFNSEYGKWVVFYAKANAADSARDDHASANSLPPPVERQSRRKGALTRLWTGLWRRVGALS